MFVYMGIGNGAIGIVVGMSGGKTRRSWVDIDREEIMRIWMICVPISSVSRVFLQQDSVGKLVPLANV